MKNHQHVSDYLNGEFPAIEGWCIPHLWQTIQPLAMAIGEQAEVGPVAEIGVYHGKFFIGLVKTIGAGANNHAIDVFDLQQFNLDGAGKGSLEQLEGHLRRCKVERGAVEILKRDSMAINRAELDSIRSKTGGFSMFSADGCHMVEHTINDILIAMELIQPHGVIFVDDY